MMIPSKSAEIPSQAVARALLISAYFSVLRCAIRWGEVRDIDYGFTSIVSH